MSLHPQPHPRRRLIVFDADSTLVATEGIDLLAEIAGVGEQVAAITARAMAGGMDFAASLRERVALLAGLPASVLATAHEKVRLTDGAGELCAALRGAGWRLGVVSGGFDAMVEPLAETLGIHHVRANRLEVDDDGLLTGTLVGTIVDRAGKAAALREWAALDGVELRDTVAVGDGANDIDMIRAAGIGIGFHPKAALAQHCDIVIVDGGLAPLAQTLLP